MRWMLLVFVLTSCNQFDKAQRLNECNNTVCYSVCREADAAWQNDYIKNAACQRCIGECWNGVR